MANTYFQNFAGTLWVQPDGPNTTPQPLLCADLDSVDEALGDITNRWCRDGAGNWVSSSRTQGTPSEVTTDVVAWRSTTRNWLDKMKVEGCFFPVYITRSMCGREDTFQNYEEGQLLAYAKGTAASSSKAPRMDAAPKMSPHIAAKSAKATVERRRPARTKTTNERPDAASPEAETNPMPGSLLTRASNANVQHTRERGPV